MTLHTVAVTLTMAAKPLSAWSLNGPLELGTQLPIATFVAFQMLPGNLLVGILHLWLMQPKYRSQLTPLQPETV
ncbi:MAG: hypothetical protein K1Y36_22920 [Blastocatellia bacterium]|nr:hypothetical protein [Blastocatellia bacterium]